MFAIYRFHIELQPKHEVKNGYFHGFYDIERWLFRFRLRSRMSEIFLRGSPALLLSAHASEHIPEIKIEISSASATRPSTKLRKYIFITAESRSSRRSSESGSGRSERIMLLAFLDIPENFIGIGNFLELFFRLFITLIFVRMILHSKFTVRFFYLVLGRSSWDSEYRIQIFLGHRNFKF